MHGRVKYASSHRSTWIVRRVLFVILQIVLTATAIQSQQMPPSEWIEEQQEGSCENGIRASITIVNDSKSNIDIFWTDPKNQQETKINLETLEYRSVRPYNAYVDQILELRETPSKDTGECASQDQRCRRVFVKVISDVPTESKCKNKNK